MGDDDGGGGGGGGGGGASLVELEEEKQKVKDLEETVDERKQENETLSSEVESLNKQVEQQAEKIAGMEKDYQIKELEVQTLDTKLKNALGAASGAANAQEQKSMQTAAPPASTQINRNGKKDNTTKETLRKLRRPSVDGSNNVLCMHDEFRESPEGDVFCRVTL